MIDFIIDDQTRSDFVNRLSKFNFDYGKLKIVTDIVKDAISDKQRCLYWLWVEAIRKHICESTKYTPNANELHEYFKDEYLVTTQKVVMGNTIFIQPSIMKLTTKEMAEYMQNIDMHCALKYEFFVPTPDDMKFNAKRGVYCA